MNVDETFGGVGFVSSYKRLDFGSDLRHDAHTGIVNGNFVTAGYRQFTEFR